MALLIIEVVTPAIDPTDYVGSIVEESRRVAEREAAKELRQLARQRVKRQFGLIAVPAGATFEAYKFDEDRVALTDIYGAIDQQQAAGLFCDIVDYPAYIKMGPNKYDNDTPLYLPKSLLETTDDDGNVISSRQRRWDEWKDQTHEHLMIDDPDPTLVRYYIPTNSRTGSRDIAVSMLRKLDEDGHNVRKMKTWPVIESEGP